MAYEKGTACKYLTKAGFTEEEAKKIIGISAAKLLEEKANLNGARIVLEEDLEAVLDATPMEIADSTMTEGYAAFIKRMVDQEGIEILPYYFSEIHSKKWANAFGALDAAITEQGKAEYGREAVRGKFEGPHLRTGTGCCSVRKHIKPTPSG